jgi:hypothetical protein
MNSRSSGEVAAHCPTDWCVVKDARDGTYFCAPLHNPEAVLGQELGQSLAIPLVIVLIVLVRRVRGWGLARKGRQ